MYRLLVLLLFNYKLASSFLLCKTQKIIKKEVDFYK